jgi:hypothetical protein
MVSLQNSRRSIATNFSGLNRSSNHSNSEGDQFSGLALLSSFTTVTII